MEKITFTFEGEDQAVEFFVLEQTKFRRCDIYSCYRF